MQREYTDGTEPDVLPHWKECHGPCQQGRDPCPTPQACERPHESEGSFRLLGQAFIAVMLLLAVVLLLLGVAR